VPVWEWTASEHLDPVRDCIYPQFPEPMMYGPDGGRVADTFHCNSVDVDPVSGDLLVSARNTDSVFYVQHSTTRILWKMGGARYTTDHAAYVEVPDPFHRQHDARFQPGWSSACAGGSGQVSLFDDETEAGAPARGVVYDVIVATGDGGTAGCDGGTIAGGTPGKATVAWQYAGKGSSDIMGSMRISEDGSRVIGWGRHGTDLVFTEVDVGGHDLLDFAFPDGNVSYRAIKAPISALDLNGMRHSTGLP
jgi:hypothetical protein